MKNLRFRQYIYWGVTAVLVITACIGITFFLMNFSSVRLGWKKFMGILAPIIYGLVLAYLLAPLFNRVVNGCRNVFEKRSKKIRTMVSKGVASFVCLITLFLVVFALIGMLIPQLVLSIDSMKTTYNELLPSSLNRFSQWLEDILATNPQMEQVVMDNYANVVSRISNWFSQDILPNLDKVLGGVSSGVIGIVTLLKNFVIGLVVMLYILNIKETLVAQVKKILYCLFSLQRANKIITEMRYIQTVFSGFFIGKLLDSLIIGVISFFILKLMKMPSYLLVSAFIGITNIIPFFGPFIGAIPSAILIFLISPVKCFYFLIFIVILQQIDGNIIGPRILGNSTGLSSFWVLFSLLLFGGLFGFVGMIIAVPSFAVIYRWISNAVNNRLSKKELSEDTNSYMDLVAIDEKDKTYQK